MAKKIIQVTTSVIGGVDTHKDTHTAVALDATGRRLGVAEFPASGPGYAELLAWFQAFGSISAIGIEGTGSYGSGLTKHLRSQGLRVVEVNRPNRQTRRRRGKSDSVDAEAAARATLAGDALGIPKTQEGPAEAVRILRLERRSAIAARTQAANQLHAAVSTAPEPLRNTIRQLSLANLIAQVAKFRQLKAPTDALSATRRVLRGLAERWKQLDREIKQLDAELGSLVKATVPKLLELRGAGTEVASALLVAAGDNPTRLGSERSFAALCGVSPVDASSGRQHRHRLNRGGNRDANRALWVIAFVRARCDPRTQQYVARRTAEGHSKLEILRCLKRYIAREVFKILRAALPERQHVPQPQLPG